MAVQPMLISSRMMVVALSRIRLVKVYSNCFGSRSRQIWLAKRSCDDRHANTKRVIVRCGHGFLTTAEHEHRRAATEGEYLSA